MATPVKYVRVGISADDDALLDRLADESFQGALKKADVGRLLIQYAIEHYADALDWYKDRGIAIVAEARKR